jgi:hypothetical protein
MKAISTVDIPLDALDQLAAELSPEIDLAVDKQQFFFKSVDPPSWVSFLAESDWWVKALAACVALYIAEIVKEAGKDTWKHRRKGLTILAPAGDAIQKLALALSKLRQKVSSKTRFAIGLPIPTENIPTSLDLVGFEPNELAVQIALFVHHLPALAALMKAERFDDNTILGGVHLKLLDDASIEVSWKDRSFKVHKRIIVVERSV